MDRVYFHIPGLIEFFEINYMLIRRLQAVPEHFREGVAVGSVFGCPPGAKWNGGRVSFGHVEDERYEYYLRVMEELKVPVRYTWTNTMLENADLADEYCNWVTQISENGFNQILVNNDLIEEYIRTQYESYPIISSTTKRITNIDSLNNELKKDYYIVVVDYDFNNQWEYLKQITNPDKCELLVNPLCNPQCPFRKRHYNVISRIQKGEHVDDGLIHECPAQKRLAHEIKQLPTFITQEDIWNKYVPNGFHHFKIEGRCASPLRVIEWYVYYMVKPEFQTEEREWLQFALETTIERPNIPIRYD